MIFQLIECLAAYKSKMEYQNKDFGADRPVQYRKIRREMAKLYDDVFGPVCLPYKDKNEEEEKLFQIHFKEENEKIRKEHVRIQEKIKHNFSKLFQKVEMLLLKISDLENKLSNVCEALAEENAERLHLQSEVKTLHKEYKVLSLDLQKKIEKLAKYTPRNVNKRLNRQKENNDLLRSQIKEVTAKINVLEEENAELNESLDRALKTTLKLRKSVSHLKIQNRKVNEKFNSQSYVQSLKDQISYLENEKCELEEKIEEFTTQKNFFF